MSKVPAPLRRHFVRGFFDGDGSWKLRVMHGDEFCRPQNDEPEPDIAFAIVSVSKPMLQAVEAEICEAVETRKPIYTYRHGKGIMNALEYSAEANIQRIFHYMYDGATVFLARKKNKAARVIQTC